MFYAQVGHDTAVFSGQGGSMDPDDPPPHLDHKDGDQSENYCFLVSTIAT